MNDRHSDRRQSEGTFARQLLIVLSTGIVSIVATVAAQQLIQFLRASGPRLSYQITRSDVFQRDSEWLSTLSISIRNESREIIQGVLCDLESVDATLNTPVIRGIVDSGYNTQKDNDGWLIQFEHLASGETVQISSVLTSNTASGHESIVSVRSAQAKVLETTEERDEEESLGNVLLLTAAPIALTYALLAVFIYRRGGPEFIMRALSRGLGSTLEKPADIASVLSLQGLPSYAQSVRQLSADTSYWAIADFLVDETLAANSPEDMALMARALESVPEHVVMAAGSAAIFLSDAARLYAELGENDDAIRASKAAHARHGPTMAARIEQSAMLKRVAAAPA